MDNVTDKKITMRWLVCIQRMRDNRDDNNRVFVSKYVGSRPP